MKNNAKHATHHEVKKIVFFIIFLLLMAFIFWLGVEMGWLELLQNQEKMQEGIRKLGSIGPLAIIFLIAIAIIISPIPSAPVALISGALYGHTFGTIYVVLGALIGALMAFMISRTLGYDYINKKLHQQLPAKMMGSQNTLMMIVFVTRLAPFISFDVISYAAGLTPLTFGRFFLATLMGIIPISFLLAHLGSEVKNGEMQSIVIALVFLGFITLIPIIFKKLKTRGNKGS